MQYRLLCALVTAITFSTTHAGEAPDDASGLRTVIITAPRIGQQLEQERAVTPGAVTTLDAADFRQRNVVHLADMLRYVPGVWAESYDGSDDVFYSSRGSNLDATDYDKNGIRFLQDGLPVSAADGTNHNHALDPQDARYVTIAHGANALAYGASTLGGAIDITTPTARDAAPFSAALSAGSFGQQGLQAALGGTSGPLDARVSGQIRQRDGYRDHSRQERRSVQGNLGWQVNEWFSTRLYATYNDSEAQLPHELTPAQYAQDPWQARADAVEGDHRKDVHAWRLALRSSAILPDGATLALGVSREQQSLYHPIVSTPFFSLLIDTDHRDTGAMLRYRKQAATHELLLGANYSGSTITGGNYQNLGGKRGMLMWSTHDGARTLELFALDRWQFAPRWTLVYGTQQVASSRDAGGVRAHYGATNPRLGVIFADSETSQWYASLSRTYEAPTTFELVDDRTGGNRPLHAMHGVVAEGGLRGQMLAGTTQLHWDASVYYTALRNEILSVDDPDAPGTSLSTNIARTTHAGIETLAGASLPLGGGGRLEPVLSLTYNAFSFDSDPDYGNNRLPAAPHWFARGELMYHHHTGLRLGPTFDLVGPRYVDFANTWRVGSFALLGLRASLGLAHWEMYAEARNLLDRRYAATVSVKDHAAPGLPMLYPGAPRALYLGISHRR